MAKKKILQITGQLSIGGQEMMAFNFFKYINRDIYDMDFLVYGNNIGELEQKIIDLGGHVIHVPKLQEVKMKQFKQIILNILTSNQYDAVHSHTYLNSGIILALAKKANIKIRVAHCHTTQSGKEKSFLYLIYKTFMLIKIKQNATHYLACGELAGESFYGKHHFINNGFVIKNGIDLSKYQLNTAKRKELRAQLKVDNKLLLGSIARFSEVKNHQFFLKIAKNLLKKNIDFCFLLIGDGPLMAQFQNQCINLELSEYFVFLGLRNDIPNLLQAIDIVLHPSIYEGVPVALIEAQAASLPCIISKFVSKEVKLTDNIDFLGIDDADVDSWINSILKYKSYQKGSNLTKLIENGYDINNSCAILEQIYSGKTLTEEELKYE